MKDRLKRYYLAFRQWWFEHDGIELFLFACIFGFLGWMGYHAIVGVIERFI